MSLPDSTRKSNHRMSTVKITRVAVLLALAIVLSVVDGMLPPLPSPVPLRYGLANVAVMAALILLDGGSAFAVAFLKSLFVLLTRGLFAGLVSMSGTLCSILVMLALEKATKGRISIFLLSVVGAVTHNFGQFLFLITKDVYRASFVYVAPFLLLFGLLTGILSATLLRLTMKPLETFLKRKIGPHP